jgi:hypothetical protein
MQPNVDNSHSQATEDRVLESAGCRDCEGNSSANKSSSAKSSGCFSVSCIHNLPCHAVMMHCDVHQRASYKRALTMSIVK